MKLLKLILLVCLFPFLFSGTYFMGYKSGCSVDNDEVLENDDNYVSGSDRGLFGANIYFAQTISHSSNSTSTEIEVFLAYFSGTNSTTIELWTTTGTPPHPDTLISGCSKNRTDIGSESWYTFTLPAAVSGFGTGTYAIVGYGAEDTYTYVYWDSTYAYGNGTYWYSTDYGVSWNQNTSRDLTFRWKGCEE